ncbi:hypothetical protein BGZ60DRAFT_405968 [Tricladium varicosporioides]|nr:hypothetical protein BGZ60DRAFT_405968 [Hymenoscyphus varicosporioides]
MLAVGQCKQLSLSECIDQNPYTSLEAREEAFWLTLFAGRRMDSVGAELSIDKMPFHEWLPRIPSTWVPASPRVTVVNTGRLKAGELGKAMDSKLNELKRIHPDIDFSIESPGPRVLSNLQSEEWTEKDSAYHTARFQELGSMWHKQPFDLYHRPFALPTVIPDPFWEARQTEDKVALLQLKTQNFEGIIGYDPSSGPNGQPWNARQWLEEALREEVPIVPRGTLDPGFESFALGRRFFITKKGYLGIGPKDTKVGDRVSVLLGLDVPLILRNRKEPSRGGWEVVGETYVQGIMEGEVIEKWRIGHLEAGKLVLH